MTEDELLEQIRQTDPDAEIRDIDGQRVLVTTSLDSHKVLFVNPASLHIIHMDPLDLSFTPDDEPPVQFKIMSYDEIKRKYGDGADDAD